MKQTEIGLIPDDWEVRTLGDLGEPCMCKRILKEQTKEKGEIPFFKIGTFGEKADAYITRELYEAYKTKYNYPKEGTLLISAAGTIGRVIKFNGEDSYFQDSNIVWIDNNEKLVINDYLYYCYKQINWRTENGGTVLRLYNENLISTQFIAPKTINEQKKIAKALSDIDSLISEIEKEIEKKKNIKTGAMQELLTGKRRLPGFAKSDKTKITELGKIPEDWEVRSLGEIGFFKNGISKDEAYFGHGSPFVNLLDVFGKNFINSNNKLGLIDSNESEQNMYSLQQGDILFVRSSVKPEGVGLTTVVMEDLNKTVYAVFYCDLEKE